MSALDNRTSGSGFEQFTVACLLVVGLCLPTSTGGAHSVLYVLVSFALVLGIFSYFVYGRGTRPGAVTFIALPLVILLLVSTLSAFLSGTPQFDWGSLARLCLLAMLLSLNLREVSADRYAEMVLLLVNVFIVISGAAILVGSEWIGQFLSSNYSQFYPELVSNMVGLHKPVLTFGTHSLAGFFIYLFFLLNWEIYKKRGSGLALFFAICDLVLLLALSSFTALAFSVLAIVQIGVGLWERSRRAFVAGALCLVLVVFFVGRVLMDQIANDSDLERLAGTLLTVEGNGPVVRYGQGGTLRAAVEYLFSYPLSPMGFTVAPELVESNTPLADSGPLEYLLRGSLPAVVLIYFGLYRFLRFNLVLRRHAVMLFLVILAFESGFTVLNYVRTFYLLPFFVICLNSVARDGLAERGPSRQRNSALFAKHVPRLVRRMEGPS